MFYCFSGFGLERWVEASPVQGDDSFPEKAKVFGNDAPSSFRDERRVNSETFMPASSDGGAPWCVAVLLSLTFEKAK